VSDELEKLQRRLEEATAADCPRHAPLDADTASLREAWLAFGQLLEAAQPVLHQPPKLPQIPRRAAGIKRPTLGIAALAASLVVGVTVVWMLLGTGHSGDSSAGPGAVASLDTQQPALAKEKPQPAPAAAELRWNDSLDEQLVQVGEEIVRLQQDWYHLDDAFVPVYQGLEQVEKDIEDSTL